MRSLLPLLILFTACAADVGDVDRTQPNRIKKTVFEGEWYLQKTTFDVPYSSGYTFSGETSLLERVRFEVQEGFLIAYRPYEPIENSNETAVLPGVDFKGAPIAAYAIESHFDVVRQYNEQTGEETNVIYENDEDRPWYEREYVRIDWSKNLVASFNFLDDQVKQSPIAYYVQDRSDADRLLIGVKEGDAWTDHQDWESIAGLERADYIDLVDTIFADPVEYVEYDEYGAPYTYPACWFYSAAGDSDCQPGRIKIRSSFLKIDENESYEALAYPDNQIARKPDGTPHRDAAGELVRVPYFDKFGYFRVERDYYDRDRGRTESGRTYLINRWAIWKDAPACKNGDSYANCTVKPIVYYLSPNFPNALKAEAVRVIGEWNNTFKAAVNQAKYGGSRSLDQVEDVVILYDNDFGLDGARGQRIGDLRYSYLYYLPEPQAVGPLGYGPSASDPLTGRIIQASAYIYGAGLESWAAFGADVVQLLNGAISPSDFIEGEDIRSYVARARGDYAARAGSESREDRIGRTREWLKSPAFNKARAKQTRLGKRGMKLDRSKIRERLHAIEDTHFEDRLMNDEVLRALKPSAQGLGEDLLSTLSPAEKKALSPARWATRGAMRARDHQRKLKLRRSNLELAAFADDGVAGLAETMIGQDWQTVRNTIYTRVFASTAEHELGHTFGLRHNFAGSFDALNYGSEYWRLRGSSPLPFAELSEEQIHGRMREHQYASIMDYSAHFYSDIQGLGLYDKAAIMFGYAERVEVFEQPPVEPLSEVFTLPYALHEMRHYTTFPRLFGGDAQAMYRRRYVPYSELIREMTNPMAAPSLIEVPYRFCSDEYEGAVPECNTFDEGADAFEVVKNSFDAYDNYYVFKAFARDSRDLDAFGYLDSIYYGYFGNAQIQYQDWVYRFFDVAYDWDWLRADAAYYGIQDVPFEEAIDGNLSGAMASRYAINQLARVLQTPEPGAYYLDPDENIYLNYSYDTSIPLCPRGQSADDCSDLNVDLGPGKYAFSLYDGDSGYYFFDRLKVVGSFYDKLAALQTLTDPETNFLGVDADANLTQYAISMHLYFPEEVSRIVGGSATEHYSAFAGVYRDQVFEFRDMFAPDASMAGTTPVDPATSFTIELYSAWLGMAFLNASFDNSFNDLMRIFEEGSGEGLIPDVTDPTRIATFTHARTGRKFIAIRAEDPNTYSMGFELLSKVKRYAEDPNLDPSIKDYEIETAVAIIDTLRGMYDLYGKMYF